MARTSRSSANTDPADTAADNQRASWQGVLEGLQRDIVYGRLQPKEHLLEDELMRRFGASRYSVRRALEELQSLGLAIRTENRGTRIRAYSPQEVFDLYDVREILETAAVQRIPMPVSGELVDELTRIQTAYDKAASKGDLYGIHMLNDEFHSTLFSACPNAVLTEQIAAYALQVQPVRMRFFLEENRRKRASIEHWGIIEALKAGDSRLLASRCGLHISKSKDDYARSVLHVPEGLPSYGGSGRA